MEPQELARIRSAICRRHVAENVTEGQIKDFRRYSANVDGEEPDRIAYLLDFGIGGIKKYVVPTDELLAEVEDEEPAPAKRTRRTPKEE